MKRTDFKDVRTDVLANWFVAFAQLANHSLSPTQTKIATQRAGEVLHAIGITEFKVGRTVFKALKPEGKEIELEATSVPALKDNQPCSE